MRNQKQYQYKDVERLSEYWNQKNQQAIGLLVFMDCALNVSSLAILTDDV